MKNLYSSIAKWLTDVTNGNNSNYEIYKYGLQIGFEQGIFIFTSIIIALFIESLGAMLLFLLVFFLIRPFVGGLHLKKFSHCYCLSVISSVGVVLLAKNLGMPIYISAIVSFCLICMTYMILVSQSKKLEKMEYQYYKKKLTVNLFIIAIILMILYFANSIQWINAITYTLCLTELSFLLKILMSSRRK